MMLQRCALVTVLSFMLTGCGSVESIDVPATAGSSGVVLASPAEPGDLSLSSSTLSAPSGTRASDAAPRIVSPCRLPPIEGIDDAQVYAAGAYKGRALDFRIDDSRHAATQFHVLVNSPDAAVVLLLGAYEPSIWNIEWTPGTRILAVVTAGYHRQRVAGIDADDIPVLLSAYTDGGPCDYFYVGGEEPARINRVARQLVGRDVALAYGADGAGRVVVGNIPAPGTRTLRGTGPKPESFRR